MEDKHHLVHKAESDDLRLEAHNSAQRPPIDTVVHPKPATTQTVDDVANSGRRLIVCCDGM
jgi:hypothetical protein